MIFKRGVVVWNMHPEVSKLLMDGSVLDRIFREVANRDAIVTSGREDDHMKTSLHYKGRAIDLRANDLTDQQQHSALNKMISALPGFDVILHVASAKIHFHLEWDPD